MRKIIPVLSAVLLGFGFTTAHAQGLTYKLGKAPTQEEIRAWDYAISPDGTELPEGSGTAKEGGQIFATRCAMCHGPEGKEGMAPALVGKNTVPMTWPFATSIWDYINRAMPLYQEGTLKTDEVYALTAFLLYKNGIIGETDALDREKVPQVNMPNKDGYQPPPLAEWKPGMPRIFKIVEP